jgi:hypothetical protein
LRFKEIIEELKDLLLLEVLQTKITNLDNNWKICMDLDNDKINLI